jgi:hypothetical protein
VLHWLAEEELLGITDFTEPGRGADRLADETTQDALERLLRHGLRPPFPGAAPDAALAAWLARIPAASLAGAIRRRGTERAPLERVAWQFGTPFLEQALAALAGSQAAAVAGLRTALQARLAVSGADSRWLDLHLLAWLARRPAARVDMAAMSAQVTAALALRLGLGQDRLLASLARQWRPPLHAALPVLAAADARTLALYYLEHGCLPATAAGLAPVQWQRLLEHGMAVVSSERMLAALRTMGEAATERVLRHVPRARLLRMLKRAGPAQAPIVEGMLAGLRQAFAREPGLDGRAADAVAGVARLLRYGSAGKAGALQAALARALAADAPALHARLLEAAGQDLERARLAQALAAPASAGVLRLLLGGEAGSAGAHRRLLALSSLLQRVLQQRAPARFGAIAVDELLRYIRLHGQHHGRAGAEPAACLRAVLARLAAEGLPAAALAGVTAGVTAGVAGRRGRWGTALREGLRQAGRDRAATALSAAAPAHPAPAVPVRRGEPLPVLPEGERFYVDNAGAVLLWPFLDRYFRTLGLMEGRDFRDDACRARAACLLQYLVDSDEDPPEYAMLLNKLLCGIAPTAPLAWTGPPDEAARTLARQLLHSVTQTWRMLKNTSIEGLQETFLARGGMLLRVDEQWTLTVDKGPFDMLLQSLPWGLSTVRLSWMESALWVKWR